ncbi:hypothetical protein FRB99_004907 [Tulasnella sp. 403]|nr:hypothetical protein FRB99_004907 [Tulasnella sp. 403]
MSKQIASPSPVVSDKFAAPPFSNDSTGDCILRSSDGVHFKTHRLILSLASPVFNDMFGIPQGDRVECEIPVIDLTESSDTVLAMLQLFYPSTSPQIKSCKLAFDLINAADKYMLELSSLRPFLSEVFLDVETLKTNPLAVYALAWKLGMKQEAEKASRYLHSTELEGNWNKNYLLSTAGDANALLALWELRHRRELALDSFLESIPFSSYRCCRHPCLSFNEISKLRAAARQALLPAYPECADIRQFFNLREILTTPIDKARYLKGNTFGPNVRVASEPCTECRDVLNFPNPDLTNNRLQIVAKSIENFPHTIVWPEGKSSIFKSSSP